MKPKYKLTKLLDGWAVEMASNGHIMENFETKGAAAKALWEFESGERFRREKIDIWVIGDSFVMEPGVGGEQWGEVAWLDMNQYNVTRRLTKEEMDALMEDTDQEHDNYPDQ